jgi:Low affinity iron permease
MRIASGPFEQAEVGTELNDRVKLKPAKKSSASAGGVGHFFGEVANTTSLAVGRASAFMVAAGVVLVWAITGPLFGYSEFPKSR